MYHRVQYCSCANLCQLWASYWRHPKYMCHLTRLHSAVRRPSLLSFQGMTEMFHPFPLFMYSCQMQSTTSRVSTHYDHIPVNLQIFHETYTISSGCNSLRLIHNLIEVFYQKQKKNETCTHMMCQTTPLQRKGCISTYPHHTSATV